MKKHAMSKIPSKSPIRILFNKLVFATWTKHSLANIENTFYSFIPFFLFFFRPVHPALPRQFSSQKSPLSGTSDLLFLVEKR